MIGNENCICFWAFERSTKLQSILLEFAYLICVIIWFVLFHYEQFYFFSLRHFAHMSVQTSILPSKEECYIKGRAVQIDKLKKKHFQSEAVLPLRFRTRLLCEQNDQSFRSLFRLSISLGTKAAHTCKSWQYVCKLACCFQNITWQRKLYPEAGFSKCACRDLEIYSGVCIYMYVPLRL